LRTSYFLEEETVAELWEEAGPPRTMSACVQPLIDRVGDVLIPTPLDVDGIALIPGDLGLSVFEASLAQGLARGLVRDEEALEPLPASSR
jgi:hypothetical protein